MAVFRNNPYGAFNYLVSLGGSQGDGSEGTIIGGFSEVSGLGFTINYSEYRNGNEKVNTARKIPNTHKQNDVVLRRGLVGSLDLFQWIKGVRDGTDDPRSVTITLLDEARNSAAIFVLTRAKPSQYVGPSLNAKGGGEVAMEELHLVHEGIEYK